MKYIKEIKTDSIEELVKNYSISINLDSSNSYSIAESIFNACVDLIIPQNLTGIFTRLGKSEAFKEDIIHHLMFNSYIVNKQKETGFVESNHSKCKKTVEELENISHFNYTRSISNYIKVLNNKLGEYFLLDKELEDNKSFNRKNRMVEQVKVPDFAAPFIFFTVINHDFHQDIKESKLPSPKLLIEQLDLYTSFIENQEDERKLISNYLFEREYNVRLFREIQDEVNKTTTIDHSIDSDLIYKTLSLLTLLPNTQGRSEYGKVLLMSKELLNLSIDENGETIGVFSDFLFTKEMKIYNWSEKVSNIILQLALFSFPIMEALHYLYTKDIKTNDYNKNHQIGTCNIHEEDINLKNLLVFNNYSKKNSEKYKELCLEEMIFNFNIDHILQEYDKNIDGYDMFFIRRELVVKHISKALVKAKNKIM